MALSQSDAPWLRHILQTLHKNGASIHMILRCIEDTVANGYKLHSYNKDECDLSILIYCIGGVNLLSALNQRLCLPSVPITFETIAKNIRSVAIEPRTSAGLTTLCGVSLLTDETVLDEAATYHPIENGVGGYCWKHAGNVYPFLDTYEAAEWLASKLSLGEVHLGKEMLVIVAHCFGEDGTYLILTAPLCKQEDHSDWETLINKLISTWYDSDAHKTISSLWSFATDGDVTRRRAGHKIFMYLPCLDGVDEAKANKLLFPDNPQDVPCAIELIQGIICLSEIDPTQPPYTRPGMIPDINVVIDFEVIKMLTNILHHLLEPFINPSLSLSQQVSHISACSHLLFCQYRLNRTAFLPNQLYYDVMTAMKNIMFCIAKQFWLNHSSKFSLLDIGTDPIEILFVLVQMCGGHNSAVNYKQGIDRLLNLHL
ncbi:hypothetical protein BDN67DRAFT_1015278 [Paxillus ammoniavirescens]|nr:hypothetical protein BDN67DRAFT_1015278 [Paxillus ammoniavirescens]